MLKNNKIHHHDRQHVLDDHKLLVWNRRSL